MYDKYVTAPSKMYYHNENKTWAYEGVINRLIKDAVIDRLMQASIPFIDVCPTEMDLPLDLRVKLVNDICEEYGRDKCLLISLHCNAGKGTGFEIWTSPGETKSDLYATEFSRLYERKFPEQKFRKDMSDGDVDKESAFYILRNSACPAILPEWLFFDNFDDWQIKSSMFEQEKYADMILDFLRIVSLESWQPWEEAV